MKKVIINKAILMRVSYLISNDLDSKVAWLYTLYQKRQKIEAYYKLIKQPTSIITSSIKETICQHICIVCSFIMFNKLELLKIRKATNHCVLKFQFLITINQYVFLELKNLGK